MNHRVIYAEIINIGSIDFFSNFVSRTSSMAEVLLSIIFGV
jgi:hypothetical protein